MPEELPRDQIRQSRSAAVVDLESRWAGAALALAAPFALIAFGLTAYLGFRIFRHS